VEGLQQQRFEPPSRLVLRPLIRAHVRRKVGWERGSPDQLSLALAYASLARPTRPISAAGMPAAAKALPQELAWFMAEQLGSEGFASNSTDLQHSSDQRQGRERL